MVKLTPQTLIGLAGHLSRAVVAVLICLSIIGAVILFVTCIAIRIHNTPRRRHWAVPAAAATVMQQPREVMATRGLDQSTIEKYKTMELGESRRPPGTNGIVCPICLSEYVSKETVRFIPECDHCFHAKCIDVWLMSSLSELTCVKEMLKCLKYSTF